MRFAKVLFIIVFILSLGMNAVLWFKQEKMRQKLSINGQVITKADFHYWLESAGGIPMQTDLVRYYLLKQAADKAGVAPKQSEIDKQLADMREANPALAADLSVNPWKEDEQTKKIEQALDLQNLSIKDVKVSSDEARSFFDENAVSGRWDTPVKITTKAILCADADTASRCKEMMEKINDLSIISQQMPGKARPVGADGTWVFRKPAGGPSRDPGVNALSVTKPGQVRILPYARYYLAIKVIKIEPGQKATYEAVRDKVERDLKLTRATNPTELLHKLWDTAQIKTDPEGEKALIEKAMFPNDNPQQQTAANQ